VKVLQIPKVRKPKQYGITLGPSGVGKWYGLGSILKEYHGVHSFVSGDWSRDNAADLARRGILVDDAVIVGAGKDSFESHGRPDRFQFDCPRSIEQVERLIEFYKSLGDFELVFWHVHAPREVCEARIIERAIRQGREDDADPVAIERRLKVYFKEAEGLRDNVVPYIADECDVHISVDATEDLETLVRPYVITQLAPLIYPAFESHKLAAA
jgi:adenylate kinase family enzyme